MLLILGILVFLLAEPMYGQSRGGRKKKEIEKKIVSAKNFVTISKGLSSIESD